MPGQVFQVVQCYGCRTFQVQQKKKVNKWICKMCGDKQSIKKIYGEGSGADCRVHVQKLNTLRGESERDMMDNSQTISNRRVEVDDQLYPSNSVSCGEIDPHSANITLNGHDTQTESRWGQYIDIEEDDEQAEEEENQHWTTDRHVYRNSLKDRKIRTKSQSDFKPYSRRKDESRPSDYYSSSRSEDYSSGYIFEPGAKEHHSTAWDVSQSSSVQPYSDNISGNKPTMTDTLKSDTTKTTSALSDSDSSRLSSMSGPGASQKLNTPGTVACKASKWSSFMEEKEESEDSESEAQAYLQPEPRPCVGSTSSVQSVSKSQATVTKWSVFQQDEELENAVSVDCNNYESPEFEHSAHLSGNILKLSKKHTNMGCVSSDGRKDICNIVNIQSDCDNNRVKTFFSLSTNEKKETLPSCSAASLFTLGDVDDEDLNLEL